MARKQETREREQVAETQLLMTKAPLPMAKCTPTKHHNPKQREHQR